MNLNRKSFLKLCGAGLGGFAAGRLSGGSSGACSSTRPIELPRWDAAQPGRFWEAVRRGYDFKEGLHYFNSGGLGPSPRAVRHYTDRMAAEMELAVETGHDRLVAARESVARFLGCDAAEVAFVRNATEANGIVAGGLALEPGDEVIFESHAHPGGSFPWILQARQRGVIVRLFEPDPESAEGNLQRIEALMTSRTRVVQVSHVTAPTGLLFPISDIAELCRQRGVWFHVDGAQTTGMLPIHFAQMGCDSYATSGHKWLGAPRETGLLLVKQTRQDAVTPPLIGAYSGELESLPGPLEFTPNAGRYEYGTRDIARMEGIVEAMRFQEAIGRERIAEHGRSLAGQLRTGLESVEDLEILTPSDAALSASILTFRSPRMDFRELFGVLWRKHQMRCRPVSEQNLNAVRVSCHLYNSPEEIDLLIAAVKTEIQSV